MVVCLAMCPWDEVTTCTGRNPSTGLDSSAGESDCCTGDEARRRICFSLKQHDVKAGEEDRFLSRSKQEFTLKIKLIVLDG